jgi:hypothetical protein
MPQSHTASCTIIIIIIIIWYKEENERKGKNKQQKNYLENKVSLASASRRRLIPLDEIVIGE